MSQLQVTGEAKIRDIQGPVVANSGVITALDGDASQYVRGDGTLADFPTSTGGGSSVSYYLNSSVSQGTIGGVAYRELSKEPIIGAGTDIAISTTGYVASYLTDANDPDVLSIPGGNFNCEFYFSVNNNTGDPFFYAELYKYDGTTFTLLGSSVGVPEYINQGTIIAPYYFAIPVATAALALTDRLAIRIYVNVDGRTVTLHTENGHLCQVVTTLSKGMVSLNNLTDQSQFITTGTSGTNFAIVSSGDTHTFNLPVASATNTGKLSSTDWSTFNNKVPYTGATANVDLGLFGLTSNAVNAIGDNSTYGGVISIKQNNVIGGLIGTGYTELFGKTNRLGISFGAGSIAYLSNSVLTAERTYTLPDLSGTLALLEGTQTFSGLKRFDLGLLLIEGATPSAVGYTGLTGDANGLVITKRVGSTGYTNLLSFTSATSNTYTYPNASGTLALLEGSQTFSGAKTFSAITYFNQSASFLYGAAFKKGNTSSVMGLLQTDVFITSATGDKNLVIQDISTSFAKLQFQDTGNLTYTFPAASGTIALTSNLSAYVPYTGATANVDLGLNILTSYSLKVDGNVAAGGCLNIKQNNSTVATGVGYNSIGARSANSLLIYYGGATSSDHKSVLLNVTNLTNTTTRTFEFPDASGTIALTSDLGAYVTLATAQVITGSKIFGSSVSIITGSQASLSVLSSTGNSALILGYVNNVLKGTIDISATEFKLISAIDNILKFQSSTNFRASLIFSSTADYSYTYPNASGTIALLSGTQTFTGATTFSSSITVSGISVGTAGNGSNIKLGDTNFGAITTGSNNIAIGSSALSSITTSNANIGIGNSALASVVNGAFNIALGFGVGASITSGSNNTLFGYGAGQSITTGNYNTILGAYAGTAAMDNNIVLSDGQGNVRYQWNGTNNAFTGAATFSSSVTASSFFQANDGTRNVYLNPNADFGAGAFPTLQVVSNHALQFATNNTLRMTISSGGNVGIGTSSPVNYTNYRSLHISGATSTSSAILYLTNSTETIRGLFFAEGAAQRITIGSQSDHPLTFSTNDTEKMRITSGGDIGMGAASITNIRLFVKGATADSSTQSLNVSNSTGTNLFYARNDGYLYSIGAWSGSDIRLKENITDLDNGLEKVLNLKARKFDLIDGLKNNYGFIAQELQEVIPHAVSVFDEKDEMLAIRMDYIIPHLVKAIQELKAEIDKLKNK